MALRSWFLLVTLVELSLLALVAHFTSLQVLAAVILVPAAVGLLVLRYEKFRMGQNALRALATGQKPTGTLADRLGVMAGAVLLIIPGILTDIAGALMLVPLARRVLMRWIGNQIITSLRTRWTNVGFQGLGAPSGFGGQQGFNNKPGNSPAPAHDRIIDVRVIESPPDRIGN